MPAKLTINANGPIKLEGEYEIVDAAGQSYGISKPVVFLCRCGQTKNNPLCDGSHKGCGFASPSEARPL